MTPPASTEPMYPISESELESYDRWYPTDQKPSQIFINIRARGPVQQAPADHEQPAYICDEDNLWDIYDILTAALAGNDLSTLPRRWNQELGIIHSRSLAEHDAALIAQEREKWEEEHTPKFHAENPDVFSPWYNVEMVAARVKAAEKKAREDVLKRLHLVVPLCDALIEKFDCQSQLGFNALLIKRELESLRSEVGK